MFFWFNCFQIIIIQTNLTQILASNIDFVIEISWWDTSKYLENKFVNFKNIFETFVYLNDKWLKNEL